MLDVTERYRRYVKSVRKALPPDLWRLYWNVDIHDAHLRCLRLVDRTLELKLDGDPVAKVRQSFRLTYEDVSSLNSTGNPKSGLAGPYGYGDLGYNEIEVVGDRLYEHRILFSSGIEFQIRFSGFNLWYKDRLA